MLRGDWESKKPKKSEILFFCGDDFKESNLSIMTQCNYCEKSDALMSCGRCRIVYYCNKDCQTSDWKKSHKKKCGKSKEDLMAEQILEDNMSLKQVKELDLLMNMMASSDSSNTPKALKMKNMMSIYARVPDLVSEFEEPGNEGFIF